MNNPVRTFIALDLADEFKETLTLVQRDLKELDLEVSWVKRDNLHLTLKFLGNVAQKKMPSVIETFQNTFQKFPAFSAELSGLGAFPNADRPKILWVGLQETGSTLQQMAESVENNFGQIGFAKENRPFEAHITIGRLRSNKNVASLSEKIRTYAFPSGIRQTMSLVTLYKSVLSSRGPNYEALSATKLSAK